MVNAFYAPWSLRERVPALHLERHCAACRVLDLPYDVNPSEVRAAITENNRRDVEQAQAAALADLSNLFDWQPQDHDSGAPCPYERIRAVGRRESATEAVVVFGGRGSGKTYEVADAIIEVASERKKRVVGIREAMTRIEDSSKEALAAAVERSPYVDAWDIQAYRLLNKKTGSEIFFVGLHGTNAEGVGKALEGVDIAWGDEAQLLAARSLEIIMPTIRKAGSLAIWTFNPGEDPTPIEELYRGPNPPERSLVVCRLVEHNKHFYRSNLHGRMRSDYRSKPKEKFRHIWRGAHYEQSDTRVFPHLYLNTYFAFSALLCGGRGPHVHDLGGFDFGYGGPDPSAAVRVVFIEPKARPDYDPEGGTRPIIYIEGEAVERAVPNHELHKLAARAGVQQVITDSNPLMCDALNSYGVAATMAEKPPGSVLVGFRRLASCDIYISPNCPVAADEFGSARWKLDRITGKIKKPLELAEKKDHTIAAVRYATSELALFGEDGGVLYV